MRTPLVRLGPRLLAVIGLALMLAVVPVVAGSCGSGSGKQFSKEIRDEMGKAADDVMAEFGVPGAIIGVWVPGEGEWLSVRGEANTKTGAKPGLGDHVRIGSITKTFTATVILQLVDEGKLSLEDKLSKFDLGVTVPNSDRITVRNLLNMTSGLFSFTASEQFWTDFYTDPLKPWTPEQLVEITAAEPPTADPGGEFDYNNTNYVLLGMIIEKLTGRPAGEEITTRIIDRLGLKNTSFPTGTKMPSPFMNGYTTTLDNAATKDIESLKDISVQNTGAWWTAGAMISNVYDLKTWVEALVEGTLLSKEMHAEQIKFEPPNTTSYGLGIMNGRIVFGHGGEVPGYNSGALTGSGPDGSTFVILLNRYPAAEEGVSDQVLLAILKVLGDKVEGNTVK